MCPCILQYDWLVASFLVPLILKGNYTKLTRAQPRLTYTSLQAWFNIFSCSCIVI